MVSGNVAGDESRQSDSALKLREANLRFAESLLEREIDQRNTRKDAQESAARWVVVTAGAIMAILVSLAKEAGILVEGASETQRVVFVITLVFGIFAAVGAIGALWPRKYDRLGKSGLKNFRNREFLSRPEDEVMGQTVSARIDIATTMDEKHEEKMNWLRGGLAALAAMLTCLIVEGALLAADPPSASETPPPVAQSSAR